MVNPVNACYYSVHRVYLQDTKRTTYKTTTLPLVFTVVKRSPFFCENMNLKYLKQNTLENVRK